MTTESDFKNKIDWKKFNFMVDCCIELEDAGNWYCLDVMVHYKVKDSDYYKTIYYYHEHDGGSYYSQLTNTSIDEYIEHYKKEGLFYQLTMEKGFGDKEKISEKIRKKLKLLDIKIDSPFWKYIYK